MAVSGVMANTPEERFDTKVLDMKTIIQIQAMISEWMLCFCF